MECAGAAFVAFGAAEAVAISGDPAVERPPDEHAAREVEQRSGPPEASQSSRQVANRLGAPVAIAGAVDDHHLLHQPIVRQVGPAAGDFGIVQREIRQMSLAIPPRQRRTWAVQILHSPS